MNNDARLFHCARCYEQVLICRCCDRGQIYCGDDCAALARRDHRREASQRYQQTDIGREKHAERQRRYRERQADKKDRVTHQGSEPNPPCGLLKSSAEAADEHVEATVSDTTVPQYTCHFCGGAVFPPFRRNTLAHETVHLTVSPNFQSPIFNLPLK